MTTRPYAPRGDSLAAHVITFFLANAEEELDLDAIAAKYGEVRNTVHTKLAAAVQAGMLVRDDSGDDWVYKPGPALNAAARGARTPTPSAIERAMHGIQRAPQTFVAIDPDQVELEDDVPVAQTRITARVDWTKLLARMRPGQSAVLPRPKRPMVNRCVKAAHESGPARFVIAGVDKDSFRIWRTE